MTTTSPSTPSKSKGRRANALPVGCMLDEYRIDSVLGAGGFGVTYKARDTHLDTWVAIKEYFPVEWSFRDPNGVTVHPNTQGDTSDTEGAISDYRWGLERFLDEARVLARIQHPYVVRVKRYFRDHGTAYIVMDYEEGQPLSMMLQGEETLREDEVRGLLEDVLPALQAVHEQGYLHRDIKPSNLYVRASDHRVLLIDFGAARQAAGRHSQSVTSLVTPGYSPPEQYTTRNDRYGTWTDIYALGAVLYRCIIGHAPTEAADRLLDDNIEPAIKAGAGRYSTNLLRVIDRALEVRPEQRFLTVADMQAALAGSQDDNSDETVIMLPITPARPAPIFETPRVTGRLANPIADDPLRPESPQLMDHSPRSLPESVESDHGDWLKLTQPPVTAHPTSVEQQRNTVQAPASQWRLAAFATGGMALVAVAAALIWLGLSEPIPQTLESKPLPRYRLGELEPSAANPPAVPNTPVSTTTPSTLSSTPHKVVDSPVPVESAAPANLPAPLEKPVIEGGSTAMTGMPKTAGGSPDLPVAEGEPQPPVTKEAPEMTDSPESPIAQDKSGSTATKSRPETTQEEPPANVTSASQVPSTAPATVAPKGQRTASQELKAPKKAQRPQRVTPKKTRPWKVIPYDPSAKKSLQGPAAAPKRGNLWGAPSDSGGGFNQK